MTPEDRQQYIESIVETLRVQEEGMPGVPAFEKERLSANLGILLYEGLHENAKTLKASQPRLERSWSRERKCSQRAERVHATPCHRDNVAGDPHFFALCVECLASL